MNNLLAKFAVKKAQENPEQAARMAAQAVPHITSEYMRSSTNIVDRSTPAWQKAAVDRKQQNVADTEVARQQFTSEGPGAGVNVSAERNSGDLFRY